MPVLPSYGNQSIDLQVKSIDWFLYEVNTGTYWANFVLKVNYYSKDYFKVPLAYAPITFDVPLTEKPKPFYIVIFTSSLTMIPY